MARIFPLTLRAAKHSQDGQANQDVAQNSAEKGLHHTQLDLGMCDCGGGRRHVSGADIQNAGQENAGRARDRTDEVADIRQQPIPQQATRRDSPFGPGHGDQVVSGEELGSPDDNQDQSQGKGNSTEKTGGSEAEFRAGDDNGCSSWRRMR